MTPTNLLSSDVVIEGTLKAAKDLTIDGQVIGNVVSQGMLVIGENARIEGEVDCRTVAVFGKLEGNMKCSERCELKSTSEINGDVKAGALAMEEGASFTGRSEIGKTA
ncbi:MAG: polymer-forming cytoskeletal protein [Verrucomicrobiota bacterium]